MINYEIKKYPDPILRKISSNVDIFDNAAEELVSEMAAIMLEKNGIGLAAPQIGICKRIIVFKTVGEDTETVEHLINPQIIEASGSILAEEGCLSMPKIYASVKRYACIRVKGKNKFGQEVIYETDKFWAVIIQHEIDHLNGKLFIDHLSAIKRRLLISKYKKQMSKD